MRVLLVVNSGKLNATQSAERLDGLLSEEGVETSSIDAEDIIIEGRFSEEAMARVNEGFDLVCTFGGDGTLLSAAQMVFRKPAPVLGLNFGTLGFLTGATSDSIVEAVEAALRGELPSENRVALNVSIEDDHGRMLKYTVLNEVALTRGYAGRIANYQVMIDDEMLANIRADGLIVASPTGSTAYSLSAGGPLITPTVKCMVVSALAPHSLISRAIVTGEDQTVELVPDEKIRSECFVFVDGNRVMTSRHPVRITVNVNHTGITLLRYNMPGFTTRASKAFYGE